MFTSFTALLFAIAINAFPALATGSVPLHADVGQEQRRTKEANAYCGFKENNDPWTFPFKFCSATALTKDACEKTMYIGPTAIKERCAWLEPASASQQINYNAFCGDPSDVNPWEYPVTYCNNTKVVALSPQNKTTCEATEIKPVLVKHPCMWSIGKSCIAERVEDNSFCKVFLGEANCIAGSYFKVHNKCVWHIPQTAQPSPRPSPLPSARPVSPSASPSASQMPSLSLAPSASHMPSRSLSPTKSNAPSKKPSLSPSRGPSFLPSRDPSGTPSRQPTRRPTFTPTPKPSRSAPPPPMSPPTKSPINPPTHRPTPQPTQKPTPQPTAQPTPQPTPVPTSSPVAMSHAPSRSPTEPPSPRPSLKPTTRPTGEPTAHPTSSPTTGVPTPYPRTLAPTKIPTMTPTHLPTASPTEAPTRKPTNERTLFPTLGDADYGNGSINVTGTAIFAAGLVSAAAVCSGCCCFWCCRRKKPDIVMDGTDANDHAATFNDENNNMDKANCDLMP
ncbi:hypothetical protein MHU86_15666 [Fragilaria crotonensis]|nr:hypothetical protein MHU86_15666 [Fragilaria crotonensis]